jgi:hypothetical protein
MVPRTTWVPGLLARWTRPDAVYTGRGLLALGDMRPAIRSLEDALNSNLSPLAAVGAMITLAGAYKHLGDQQREASLWHKRALSRQGTATCSDFSASRRRASILNAP